MKIPLGDIIRKLAPPGSIVAKIFQWTKGIVIRRGDVEIHLNERDTIGGRGSDLDKPHRPGPIR